MDGGMIPYWTDEQIEEIKTLQPDQPAMAFNRIADPTFQPGGFTVVMGEANQFTPGWRPIETAPKDEGVQILVWDGEGISVARRSNFGDLEATVCGKLSVEDNGMLTNISPTHWMPLPEPPSA